MTRSVVRVQEGMTLRRAANLMRGRNIGCLPVVKGPKLVGIVTTTDLLELLGRGADRGAASERRGLHHRVPHRKRMAGAPAW